MVNTKEYEPIAKLIQGNSRAQMTAVSFKHTF